MTHGIDTDFLVAVEVLDHPFHLSADALLRQLLDDGHDFALAPQTLAEFVHVVTDARRFPQPLTAAEAINKAVHWWQAQEVLHVFPGEGTVTDFFAWFRRQQLGRKRLLDTMLAATFHGAGITRIITNNARDFERLGGVQIIGFQ